MKVRVNNIPEKKPLPFWIVTRKFAVEEFSEIAEKLKHSWIPFQQHPQRVSQHLSWSKGAVQLHAQSDTGLDKQSVS